MIKLDYVTPFFCDVDNTLVMHGDEENERAIQVEDPYTGYLHLLVPNKHQIGLLKRKHCMGVGTIVWSHAGTKWAVAVIDALGIEEYVDVVMPKVEIYADDVPIKNWQFINLYLHKPGESPNGDGRKE